MPYQKYQPHLRLRPYVSDYFLWELDVSTSTPFSITCPANPRWAMVFNFSAPYRLYNARYEGRVLPAQFLSGQSTGPYTLEFAGSISMAGIVFTGHGIQHLFGLPLLRELADDRIDLLDLLGQEAQWMMERLAQARSSTERIGMLDQFLLARIPDRVSGPTPAGRAEALILARRGMVKMDEIAQRVYLSPRQLRRTFKNELGINPKFYARLKRFNYVNFCLTKYPEFSWHHFLEKGAFYDQSHFIKDYQAFFGSNPLTQIAENRRVAERLAASATG